MSNWAALPIVVVLTGAACLAGCTRLVDAPQAQPAPSVGPISTQQVHDLLSPEVATVEGNQFDKVEPERCRPVAREVAAPFLTAHKPAAIDGGHWQTEAGDVVVEEIVAVYPTDFDPDRVLAEARDSVESCRDDTLDVTTLQGRTYQFRVAPNSSAPAGSVLWSLHAGDWNCNNLLVAAHNAAIEITTCGTAGGLDTAALAEDALNRIEALANSRV